MGHSLESYISWRYLFSKKGKLLRTKGENGKDIELKQQDKTRK